MSNIPRGAFMQVMEKYTKSLKAFISAQGFGHYSKPNGGIPKTDLDQSVQTSLGKADTALQGFTESDPTVPAWAKASSKPSYTASEVGLGNVGNFKAVSTVASQGLSDTEKANARTNIGAGTGNGTYSKPSGGIPKSDLASAVQTSLGKADSALQSESDPTVPAWAKQSSKPSYTASEVGLGNVGNFKAVSTVASQGLSDTEKANARTNIGAGTSSFSGSYNDLSDKPTIPTKVSQLANDSGYTANTGTVTGVKVGSTSYSPSSGVVSLPAYPTTLPASDVSSWAKQSSKPSYTASEVGLGNVGNFKAVSTVASQGLSSTEQANARANIGAGTSSFSGSYNDLSNKPTIPTKVSQLTNDAGYTTNTGTYSKPSGGIPKSDLASAVQTSLGKADTALQSHQTIKQDGVTGATVNRFGTCSTAAATAAKTVSITSGTFNLEAGARVAVKFTNANTAGTPTLNVNSKGAKNIFHKGAQITTGSNKSLLAGTVDFIYDGTQWHLIGNYIDTNTTYSAATTSAAGLMSAADKTKLNGIATGAQVNSITGVKGDAESSYRTGNVNLTPANIGAAPSSLTVMGAGLDEYNAIWLDLASLPVMVNQSSSPLGNFLDTTKVPIGNGNVGTVAASQSYACCINHIVSVHVCVTVSSKIAVGQELTLANLNYNFRPYGDGYNFYPLTLAFYSGTPIAGVQCYMRGEKPYIYVKPLQAEIPANTALYINGTYITEGGGLYPPFPT